MDGRRKRTLILVIALMLIVEAMVIVAALVIADGDAPTVEQTLRERMKANPLDAMARIELGYELQSEGRLTEARQLYDAALLIEPVNTAALFNRATVNRLSGEATASVADYQAVLAIDTGHAEAAVQLGRIFVAEGDYPSMMAVVESAANVHPESAELQYLCGLGYESTGRGDLALVRYRAALAAAPDMSEAKEGLSRLGAGQ